MDREREDRIRRAQELRKRMKAKAEGKEYCTDCVPGMAKMTYEIGKGEVCFLHFKPLPKVDHRQVRK